MHVWLTISKQCCDSITNSTYGNFTREETATAVNWPFNPINPNKIYKWGEITLDEISWTLYGVITGALTMRTCPVYASIFLNADKKNQPKYHRREHDINLKI